MPGRALEVAVALWRMPAMRTTLRSRPLPAGVREVIELAAGNPARLQAAAARLGEPPGDVLEAARFYVREVLLASEGDAYRVLGLAADAAQGDIKGHHRALQHWLHPDRGGSDWDSVFAARINTAWSLLRTPERRASYDALRRSDGPATPPRARRVLVPGWRAAAPQGSQAWRLLLLPVLALGACVWLLVLVDRQAGAPPPSWNDAPEPVDPALAALAAVTLPAPAEVAAGPTEAPGPPAIEWTMATPAEAPAGHAVSGIAPGRRVGQGASMAVERAATTVRAEVAPRMDDPLPSTAPGGDRVAPAGPPPSAALPAGLPDAAPPATSAPEAPASGAPAWPATPPTIERIQLAQLLGRDVTDYLDGLRDIPPPVWGTVSALDAADALRLPAGASTAADSGRRFAQPTWRIGSTHATMRAPILHDGGRTGMLEVELAWRDGMWLVDALHAEAAQ